MRLLLDTHSFLWFVTDDPRLTTSAKQVIEDIDTELFLSMASVWEMAIKVSIGKLSLAQPIEAFVLSQLVLNSISLLDIALPHALAVATLPFHHRDPFDRLLIVQAQIEGWPLVSADSMFDQYGVRRIWD
ncbi:MAG TPA: type II toxin-antitoxin system VapC family toxin [Roseiflexaceae bacterium]|nr:type II toxin-antitoxin system VapC family toxin [Roseiflexaceae bacterium]